MGKEERKNKGKRKIRVIHLISRFDLGGAERVAANIAKSGNPDYEYHILEILRGKSDFTKGFIQELQAAGVVCHRSRMPNFHFHFMAERIAAILFPLRFLMVWLRYKPDVIHAHTETPDMCLWAFFRMFPWLQKRCRIVRTIHNTCLWTGLKRFGSKVERFYQRNDANIAISRSVLECYTREYGSTPPIIYNGVPEADALPYPDLVADKTNILFAGRFEEQKGISHLIYIVSRLADMPHYHFHIVGAGSMQPLVEKELATLPNVTISKPIFGISRYLGSFDYMLMPSEFEGLPLMSVEASMAGLPVICSDCKGLNETVPHDWPLIAHANSNEDYLEIFFHTIPASQRADLSLRARRFVEKRFAIKTMQQEYEKVYSRHK